MPYYKGTIDHLIAEGVPEESQRVADTLLRLRTRLAKEIPERNVNRSILLATWNLREFGRNDKFGKRLEESILYIAEVVSRFDLVAIQEVHANLEDLHTLMALLGAWWDYLVTDVTPGPSGNQERIAFVYDTRKVVFDHLAGELSLPPSKTTSRQPARSPFICSFKTGWRRISLCSVHIYYGTAKAEDLDRVEEIRGIAGLLAQRNQKRQDNPDGEPDSVVLLGDFNIFNRAGDATSEALEEHDFVVPTNMRELPPTNLGGDRYFDQIAFHDPLGRLKSSCAGVFNFTAVAYGPKSADAYKSAIYRSTGKRFKNSKELAAFYSKWRTFQMSDHLPLWVELRTDFSEAYLATAMRGDPRAK